MGRKAVTRFISIKDEKDFLRLSSSYFFRKREKVGKFLLFGDLFLELNLIRMGLKLTGKCTRSAAEFGIIFVITVIAFDNQRAVGEVFVVVAI